MELFEKFAMYDFIVIGLGVFTYYLYAKTIKKERGLGQSILSWVIWVVLDIIQIFMTVEENGYSALLLSIFIVGGIYIIKVLHDMKNLFTLSFSDIVIIFLIVVCFFIGNTTEDKKIAIIFASIVQFIAGIPLLEKILKEPKKRYLLSNFGFLAIYIVGLRSLFFSKFEVEDHLLQLVLLIYMMITILIIVFKEPKKN